MVKKVRPGCNIYLGCVHGHPLPIYLGSESEIASNVSELDDISGYHLGDDESAVGTPSEDADNDDVISNQSDSVLERPEAVEKSEPEEGMAIFSQTLLKDNIEKGKAARKQISKKCRASMEQYPL